MVDDFGMDCREGYLPGSISQNDDGSFDVEILRTKTKELTSTETFDTILLAISRYPLTAGLNLKKAGVKMSERSGKILGGVGDQMEQTSASTIYAIGDVLEGVPELTPTASMCGVQVAKRVAQRLGKFGGKVADLDFSKVPTTVFSYPEYSTCGLSEEEATKLHGEDSVEVWHSISTPLEENLSQGSHDSGMPRQMKSYFKLVCLKDEAQTVLGIHYLGQNAGEIMQGFSVSAVQSNIPGRHAEGTDQR